MSESVTPNAPDVQKGGASARIWISRILGPVAAVAAYFLLALDPELSDPARATAAVAVLMAIWWMTEALPLAATSLIPIVAFPLFNVYQQQAAAAAEAGAAFNAVSESTAPYADRLIFLFMGGFMIALAMQKWNLHKRIALLTMRLFGSNATLMLLGMMVATAFMSMWVSNTATTLMMLPIGISVLAVLGSDDDVETRRFGVALMLAIAYSASIGGLGTIIGSPPNVFMVGHMEDTYGMTISFADWMMIGVPLAAVFIVLAWFLLTKVLFRSRMGNAVGGREAVQRQLDELGPTSRGEWIVLVVFCCTALLWIFKAQLQEWEALVGVLPFVARLDDTVIAIAAAVVLFLIPVSLRRRESALDWQTVQKGIPWGVLLLFGGGLSLANAVGKSGLADYIGARMAGLEVLPVVLLVAVVALVVLFLTELTSNTATATTFIPLLAAIAVAIDIDPMLLAMPAALAATCAFMLPVGTPPNAIVFGTGRVQIGQMIRAGVLLNVAGVLLVTLAIYALGGWALGLRF